MLSKYPTRNDNIRKMGNFIQLEHSNMICWCRRHCPERTLPKSPGHNLLSLLAPAVWGLSPRCVLFVQNVALQWHHCFSLGKNIKTNLIFNYFTEGLNWLVIYVSMYTYIYIYIYVQIYIYIHIYYMTIIYIYIYIHTYIYIYYVTIIYICTYIYTIWP